MKLIQFLIEQDEADRAEYESWKNRSRQSPEEKKADREEFKKAVELTKEGLERMNKTYLSVQLSKKDVARLEQTWMLIHKLARRADQGTF